MNTSHSMSVTLPKYKQIKLGFNSNFPGSLSACMDGFQFPRLGLRSCGAPGIGGQMFSSSEGSSVGEGKEQEQRWVDPLQFLFCYQ